MAQDAEPQASTICIPYHCMIADEGAVMKASAGAALLSNAPKL